jgi:hypothetical protein
MRVSKPVVEVMREVASCCVCLHFTDRLELAQDDELLERTQKRPIFSRKIGADRMVMKHPIAPQNQGDGGVRIACCWAIDYAEREG